MCRAVGARCWPVVIGGFVCGAVNGMVVVVGRLTRPVRLAWPTRLARLARLVVALAVACCVWCVVWQWCSGGAVASRRCCGGVAVVSRWCCGGVAVALRWCCGGAVVVLRW